MPSIRNAFLYPFGPLLEDHLLTSIIKLCGQLTRGKPLVSWRPLWKDLCQCWIVHFAKHSSPYASRSKAHVLPISFPNQTQKLIATFCLERMFIFFSVSYIDQHHACIYWDYSHCYTHCTRCHPVSFGRYILPLRTYVLPNIVSRSPYFL